jgi:hypothetical protein
MTPVFQNFWRREPIFVRRNQIGELISFDQVDRLIFGESPRVLSEESRRYDNCPEARSAVIKPYISRTMRTSTF